MTEAGDCAFPISTNNPEGYNSVSFGLTKREYFAAMAMQGLLANYSAQKDIQDEADYDGSNFAEVLAKNSIGFANALIEQLNKQ